MVMTSARWLVPVAYLTVYLVWGSTYLAIRFGVETMSPSLLFGCRFLLAGLINLALYRVLCGVTGETPRRPSRRQVANASVIGCVLLIGGTGLVGWAEQTVDSHLAALIVSSTPLWVTLFDSALRRTVPASPTQVLGMTLGVAGVAILTGAGGSRDAMEHIEQGGLYAATFLYNPSMSASAVRVARLIALGEGFEELVEPEVPSRIELPATTVTQDNVEDFLALGF